VGDSQRSDSIWQSAVEWVMREHEQPFDQHAQNRLREWLEASDAHKAAYEKARHAWLLTGLLPPKHDM
jgi:ferric-dicitrate binding protein FerR (iron transport regulator)